MRHAKRISEGNVHVSCGRRARVWRKGEKRMFQAERQMCKVSTSKTMAPVMSSRRNSLKLQAMRPVRKASHTLRGHSNEARHVDSMLKFFAS